VLCVIAMASIERPVMRSWRMRAPLLLLLAGWPSVEAFKFPHIEMALKKPRSQLRVPLRRSNETAWVCGSFSGGDQPPAVSELCELTRKYQMFSMDYFRAQWHEHNCEIRTYDGWMFPDPCYYDMWRHYWESRMDIANYCWGQQEVPWCGITAFAVVLIMLKQGQMWDEAQALFDFGEEIGINAMTQWKTVFQVAWFVPMRPDASPSIYVPGGIGRMDEPVSPYSYGDQSMDNGFFDVWTAEATRPIAEKLLPNIAQIIKEWTEGDARAKFGGPETAWANRGTGDGDWTRYRPGKEGFQNWWDMGKAALTGSIRIWGGYPGNIDTWWNIWECPRISTTLCKLLQEVLPTTARPTPQYVLDTSSRWEHVDIKRILPGANQAMHADPCRCLWQICIDGCEGAFLQVGKIVKEYKAGEMVAFDATYEHTVWVREENEIARTVIHGVLHYCNGSYAP